MICVCTCRYIYYIGTRVFIVIYIVCVMRVRLCIICVFVIVVCALILAKIMQTESRASSLLERFAEVQPILCKDNANREQSVKLA